jgi:hypothetical protein
MCKVGAKESMAAEEIRAIKKKPGNEPSLVCTYE